jgi:hypothetical protein
MYVCLILCCAALCWLSKVDSWISMWWIWHCQLCDDVTLVFSSNRRIMLSNAVVFVVFLLCSTIHVTSDSYMMPAGWA